MEGSDRVEFRDVEALSYRRLSLVCIKSRQDAERASIAADARRSG